MAYPGNPDLSLDAQERVLSTFREVIRNLQAGRRDEALVGLEFVLRLDPAFAPAAGLQRQLASGGGELDLGDVLESLAGPSPEELAERLVEAVELFNERRFLEAKQAAEGVLRELPGHQEARQLLNQVQEALKVEAQVGGFLAQAREALDRGEGQEAANFVLMAQALDPNHPGIAAMLEELQQAAPPAAVPPAAGETAGEAEEFRFETFEETEAPEAKDDAAAPLADEAAFSFEQEPRGEPSFDFDFSAEEPRQREETVQPSPAQTQAVPPDDLGDLFSLPEEEGPAPEAAPPPEAGGEETAHERVQELLVKGQAAFDAGSYQEAIDIWSRIYLIDPSSESAGERIDAARARLEEQSRELELLLHEANEAAERGDTPRALEMVERVLAQQSGHLEALDLKERLEREAGESAGEGKPETSEAVAPPAGEGAASTDSLGGLLELQGDLFREDFPQQIPTPAEPLEIPELPPTPAPAAARRRTFPVRTIALALAALVVVAMGAWFGSRLLSRRSAQGDAQALERTIREADRLVKSGRVEEAIHLLQEAPASPVDQPRIARRIARYQKVLQPPTPTPVPAALHEAEEAARQGHWLSAYRAVIAGLREQPDDPGLLELKDQIASREPLVVSLERAIARHEPADALSVARQLVERHPGDPEVNQELDRQLFNAAVEQLRTYNLTGAEVLLTELQQRQPADEEVRRILELIRTYKNRPVDMQLKIFISSIKQR